MQLWNYTDRFVRERKILNNISAATADWYHYSLKAFKPVLEAEYQSIPELRTAIITRIGESPTAFFHNQDGLLTFLESATAISLCTVEARAPRPIPQRQFFHETYPPIEWKTIYTDRGGGGG